MPTLQLSDQQVVDLFRQLPPDSKRAALLALAQGAAARRDERMRSAEARIEQLSAERGLDWKNMSEDDREALIDDLVRADRQFRKASL